MHPFRRSAASIAEDEIARFSRHADDWWNPGGAFRPLHKMNPLRLRYIRDVLQGRPLRGLDILDVGCGGGLLAEPLARLGANVTGLDASKEAIAAARGHAEAMRLNIDYLCGSAENLARGKARFDVVTAMEVVEHVADLDAFVGALAALLKPGGVLILSTLNRTPKSFALGVVAAEYILNWAPRGTHQWSKFVKPSELVAALEAHGLTAFDMTGVVFSPARSAFELSKQNVAVNYMMAARRSV